MLVDFFFKSMLHLDLNPQHNGDQKVDEFSTKALPLSYCGLLQKLTD